MRQLGASPPFHIAVSGTTLMETDYHALPPERQPSRGKQRWNAMPGLLRSQAGALRRVRAAGLNPRRHRNSPLAQMLSATSKARHAVLYRNILAGLIVLSVLLFTLSTVRAFSDYRRAQP